MNWTPDGEHLVQIQSKDLGRRHSTLSQSELAKIETDPHNTNHHHIRSTSEGRVAGRAARPHPVVT